jgi:hypothetical protein
MTEYIFKYDKLLPLPEKKIPEVNDYTTRGQHDSLEFDGASYKEAWAVYKKQLSAGITVSEELKLEEGKVYREGLDFKIVRSKQIYFSDQQQYQQMSMEEKEAQFEHIAIPVSTAQKEDSVIENDLLLFLNYNLQESKKHYEQVNDKETIYFGKGWIAALMHVKINYALLTAHQNKENGK